ncbi:hypothetical protein JIQ42_02003 [Leishmania sp. Namibia]|uniref:hypothetical protein n=1 Tax=Leishmania sp. Namibia TaxID=2802991 RepID=UPI001B469A06|nr:hypothetical protein JIQ42_02003 [Leishmania sp. Namibia]
MQGAGSCGGSGGTPIAGNRAELCRDRTTTTAATRSIRSSAVGPNLLHIQPTSRASFTFTLVSADGVSFHFCVTAGMCTNSLYLRSARDVGASEGSVPVGSAQAVRDYVVYLQYSDFRKQLAAELARSTTAATAAATASPLPAVTPLSGFSHAEYGVRRGGAWEARDAVPSWMFSWDEDEVNESGVDGYALQPLDCDRAYTRHASHLRHGFTATEMTSFRGETAVEDAALARTGDDRHGRSPVAPSASPMLAMTSTPTPLSSNAALSFESIPLGMTPDDAPESTRQPHHSSPRLAATSPSSPPSSTSLSSSVSAASLEAYESAARATDGVGGGPCGRRQRIRLGEELGYGELVALGDPEGLYFVEHVLLAYDSARSATSASTTEARWTDDNPFKGTEGSERGLMSESSQGASSTPVASQKMPASSAAASSAPLPLHPDPNVTLTMRQQCRLLELISVADFMGTQPLVELCATYLATWLMDRTDEEIVQSFLTTASPISAATGASAGRAPTLFKATGATPFNEPWIAPIARDSVAPGISGEATGVSRPSAGASSMSGVGKSRMETAAATAATAKKRNVATAAAAQKRAGKQKSDYAASTDATAAKSLDDNGGGGATYTSSIPGDSAQAPPLLTGDQRLALLRQMKRDNSIMVTPY